MAATTSVAAMNLAAPVELGNPAQKASRVFNNTVSFARVEKASLAAVTGVKIEGPPPPAGGLPGTENSDQARDFEAPLRERFFIQIKTPEEALARAKDVVGVFDEVQGYITKKAWPYVRNELRSELGYLRYDLATVIASKAKAEKKALNAELKELITTLESLDYAARVKDQEAAQKFFDATKSKVSALLAKL
ncbi:unnamed protein product [Closterium sp. Yama58-4]|nr:unnamed protein product [Closterium sp. Yama58-4]